MDFELSQEQMMIKENIRKYLETEIAPLVNEYENNQQYVPKDIIKKLIPFGFIGGLLPEDIGGYGLDHVTYFIMIEELSRIWPSLRAIVSGANQLATRIYHYGSEKQKEKYLNSLLK